MSMYWEDNAAESFKDENWRQEVVKWILVDGFHADCHEFFRLRLRTCI